MGQLRGIGDDAIVLFRRRDGETGETDSGKNSLNFFISGGAASSPGVRIMAAPSKRSALELAKPPAPGRPWMAADIGEAVSMGQAANLL